MFAKTFFGIATNQEITNLLRKVYPHGPRELYNIYY